MGRTGACITGITHPIAGPSIFQPAATQKCRVEQFNLDWLHAAISERDRPQDVQATLVQLTAHGIINAIASQHPAAQDIFLCGGGAHNITLTESMKKLAPQYQFFNTDALGISADWLEAHAFAWLGWQTLLDKPANRPEVTGAAHPCILGAIYPA